VVSLLVLQACPTTPTVNARLDEARRTYAAAQANPQVRDGAAVELKRAADALAQAEAAAAGRDDTARIEHLSYLALQSVVIAQQTGERKSAEGDVARANIERDQLRLAARTREADVATRNAQVSQLQAQSAQRQAGVSQMQSEAAQRDAMAAQQQAGAAEQRSALLEGQLRDLNARKTPRGMVITIGDVLFDTGRAELKSGAERSMDKLVAFLKENPQRQAVIEGFTDSVGSESMNQDLSRRRADAVRGSLVIRGVEAGRMATEGYGEAYPVAGNDSASGRQMNRRVEIVLSDEGGRVAPR
jgi:outer membrane protein OmpA-like peptidoglycan-associated protein